MNHKEIPHEYREFYTQSEIRDRVEDFVAWTIEEKCNALSIEEAILPAAFRAGAGFYSEMAGKASASDAEGIALTMLLIGLMIGFEAGHEQGLLCAAVHEEELQTDFVLGYAEHSWN